jgi:hypothetical protein
VEHPDVLPPRRRGRVRHHQVDVPALQAVLLEVPLKHNHMRSVLTRVTRDRCYDFKKYFRRKILVPAFFAQNAKFFAENWQKSQKIVITTSTPDWSNFHFI